MPTEPPERPPAAAPAGLVLAGGRGRRMGRPKAGLCLPDGRTLARRAVDTLAPLCSPVMVAGGAAGAVAGAAAGSRDTGAARVVADPPPPGRGPLAGLAAGYRAAGRGRTLVVLACDYPAADEDLLRRLLERAAASDSPVVLPVDSAGRDHPLVAVWRPAAAAAVEAALADGRLRVGALLAGLDARRVGAGELGLDAADLDARLVNVNRAEAWRRWLDRRR